MDEKEAENNNKCSLRNEKLKANRASETEEKRKGRLRIRREKDRARRRTKKPKKEKKRSSETENHKKQRLATLKRLKQCDENVLERKVRLEKVTSKQLSSGWPWNRKKKEEQDWSMMQLPYSSGAMETDEERKARLEKMVATIQLRLALETEEERRAKKRN